MITTNLKAWIDAMGSITGAQVVAWPLPENFKNYPAITFYQDNAPRETTFSGQTGLVEASIVFDFWGKNGAQLRELVVAFLAEIRAHGHADTVGGVPVFQINVDSVVDLFDTDLNCDRVRISSTFWHKEILPS